MISGMMFGKSRAASWNDARILKSRLVRGRGKLYLPKTVVITFTFLGDNRDMAKHLDIFEPNVEARLLSDYLETFARDLACRVLPPVHTVGPLRISLTNGVLNFPDIGEQVSDVAAIMYAMASDRNLDYRAITLLTAHDIHASAPHPSNRWLAGVPDNSPPLAAIKCKGWTIVLDAVNNIRDRKADQLLDAHRRILGRYFQGAPLKPPRGLTL